MMALLRIHALVRAARVLLLVGRAAEYVRAAPCRKAGALADEATAWCDARGAAGKLAGPKMHKEMHRHVMALLERYNIIYSWCRRPKDARAVFYTAAGEEFHEVWIMPIRSAISYATALHEIGHILGRHQRSPDTLVRERWAWRWAKENALIWTPAMEKHCSVSLAWYEVRRER